MPVLPRVSDIYAAMPGITGKLELEYEGEMKGADTVVRELIRSAVGKVYDRYFEGVGTEQIEQWFNLGGTVKMDEDSNLRPPRSRSWCRTRIARKTTSVRREGDRSRAQERLRRRSSC